MGLATGAAATPAVSLRLGLKRFRVAMTAYPPCPTSPTAAGAAVAGELTGLDAGGGGNGRFARSVRNMPTASTTLTIPSATLITSSRRDTLIAPSGRRRQQIPRDGEGGQ